MNPSKGPRVKYTLRIPLSLHRRIEAEAQKKQLAVNSLICDMLMVALDSKGKEQ